MNKFNFSYDNFVKIIERNKDNMGDKNGDNGKYFDALIVCYYLMQKYEENELKEVSSIIAELSNQGLETLVTKLISDLKIY